MLVSFLLVIFLFFNSASRALIIDKQKPIKTKNNNSHLSSEAISLNLLSSYENNNVSSDFSSEVKNNDTINIDENGRQDKKEKKEMSIKVSLPEGAEDTPLLDALQGGYKAFNQGKIDLAMNYYKTALRKNPKNVDAIFGVAACEQIKNNGDVATKLYLRILKLDPRNVAAINNLIMILSEKDLSTALSTMEQLEKMNVLDPMLFAQLGSLKARNGDYTSALRFLKIGLNKLPQNALIMYSLAIVYEEINNEKLALEYYEKTLANITPSEQQIISMSGLHNKIKELSGK